MQMKTEIYALKDENGVVRYVGKSSHSSQKRYSRHLADGRNSEKTHKACWIRGMLQRGLTPTMDIIDVVDGDGLDAEMKWIKFFRDAGVNLTNLTDGGEGPTGRKYTPEQLKKHREAMKHSFEYREIWNKGKRMPEETRRKMSASRKGRKFSKETKKKISKAKKGMKFSEEHIENLRKSHTKERHVNYGKHLSEETRRKISEGMARAHREGRGAKVNIDKNTGRFVAAS